MTHDPLEPNPPLSLKKYGYPTLSQIAADVEAGDPLDHLIERMTEIMLEPRGKIVGIGLAANQVGVLKRVVVFNLSGLPKVIINPVITKRRGGLKTSREGCLSFPGRKVAVKRYNIVKVKGYDMDGNPLNIRARGLAAFCVQHEIDHLNGVTI